MADKQGVVDLTKGFIQFVNKEAFELLRAWYGLEDPEHLKEVPVVADDNGKPLVRHCNQPARQRPIFTRVQRRYPLTRGSILL